MIWMMDHLVHWPKIPLLMSDLCANSSPNAVTSTESSILELIWQMLTELSLCWVMVLLSQFFSRLRALKERSAVQEDTGQMSIIRISCSTANIIERTSGTMPWNAVWASSRLFTLYFEWNIASWIFKEGDSERLVNCWPYSQHTSDSSGNSPVSKIRSSDKYIFKPCASLSNLMFSWLRAVSTAS